MNSGNHEDQARVRALTQEAQGNVAALRGRRVLVLGDAILDEYLTGDCSRISPEAPVPVLRVRSSRQVLGGAANTAANVASLGGRARLVALAGPDAGGEAVRRMADEAGVDVRLIDGGMPTLRKTRVIGQQQQIVRLDYEDVRPITASVESRILRAFDEVLSDCDIVVISDYAKGFLSIPLAHELVRRAHSGHKQVIVDPRPEHRDCYVGCDYITPNWREARALLGLPWAEPDSDATRVTARAIASELGCNVLLTLGSHGMRFCSRDASQELAMPTLALEVFDVSGAGDTVVAAFALARAGGLRDDVAIALANKAASVVVGKLGTATVTAEELTGEHLDSRRLISRAGLAALAARVRSTGKTIVSINGSFDLLHSGHLYILGEARKCGDVLVVGLNSDASVRSYKGEHRLMIPQTQRAEMLLALRFVDYVHIFDEANPIEFLKQLRPDVHVNGAEYGNDCVERATVEDHGGRLHLVGRLPGMSTTDLAERLQASEASIQHRD